MESVTHRSCIYPYVGPNRTVEVLEREIKVLLSDASKNSLDITTDQDGLSEETRTKLLKVSRESGVGPIKLTYRLSEDGSDCLDFLGHVGEYRVIIFANSSERYHGLLVLGENDI